MLFLSVLISAVLYAASFLGATFLWPLSFFCYVPLFRCQFISYRQAFLQGIIWGLVAYTALLWALLDLIVLLGKGPWGFLYAVSFLFYFSFFSALWFVTVCTLSRCTKKWWVGWVVSTVLYGVVVYKGMLYGLTGAWQGYPLAFPLLPLMEVSSLLGMLPYTGWFFLLIVFCCFQAGIAYKEKSLVLLGGLPFLLGWFLLDEKHEKQEGGLIIPCAGFFHETRPYERAQEVCDLLLKAEQKNPQAQVLVLSESAFPFPLQEHPYALLMWQGNGTLFEKYLAVPAHYRKSQTELHNSVYLLHKGRIIYRYDKKQLLPFFEKECSFNPFLKRCHTSFLQEKEEFEAGDLAQHPFKFSDGHELRFCICSELLWDFPTQGTVIVMVHDGHYRYAYFSHLFKLLASFKAQLYQTRLAYAAWTCSFIQR